MKKTNSTKIDLAKDKLKLSFHKETIRELQPAELEQVVGGRFALSKSTACC